MKRLLALTLSLVVLLTGCTSQSSSVSSTEQSASSEANGENAKEDQAIPIEEVGDDTDFTYEVKFDDLDDAELLAYVEDSVYQEVVSHLNSEEYYVENVSAIYVSKEYLEDSAYNSQSNIFFGFTLSEIEETYGDSKYVFTLGEDGSTIVQPFEEYDDTYEKIIKNVAIGSGVILVCVTVSVVTAGAGAPAVSLIFATSAKTGTIMALSSGALGGVASGVVTGIETGDMNQAVKEGALAASDGFKWGAITGVITGGATETVKYTKAMKALKGVELNLSLQEAAAIQMETGYPAEVIAQFHTMEEYEVFKAAGLKAAMVNGETALVRNDINLNLIDEYGNTNLERMKLGKAPLDEFGNYYELHHIGQESDATLAILTQAEHDNAALHGFKTISEIDRPDFAPVRKHFWKTMAKLFEEGAI